MCHEHYKRRCVVDMSRLPAGCDWLMAAIVVADLGLLSACDRRQSGVLGAALCHEIESRGACSEGSPNCVLVACGPQSCHTDSFAPSEGMGKAWVTSDAVEEVGVWCEEDGNGIWHLNWCDDLHGTDGEYVFDAIAECVAHRNL